MNRPRVIADAIPECLKQRPQWVCWKYVERAGNKTKCPVHANFGWNASAADPGTWCKFEDALRAYERTPQYAGIAYAFSADDPYFGIDIDDCFDEQGNLLWGDDLVEMFGSYCEVSPSGHGLKLIAKGTKPDFARCKAKWFDFGTIEIYDQKRVFALTGRQFGEQSEITDRQWELDALCTQIWTPEEPRKSESRFNRRCLNQMLRLDINDRSDGSHRLFTACCRAVEHNLSDQEAIATLREYERLEPFPKTWSDDEIITRLRDAEQRCERGAARSHILTPEARTLGTLMTDYPELREPVVHGLLRVGETMNVIASPKYGKSWLVTDLCLALATGRTWLDHYPTEPCKVLILDNELHPETSAYRIPKVADARGIAIPEIATTIEIENLRGRLVDIFAMADYFDQVEPERYQVIVIDAFYRFMPRDSDENDNGTMTNVYNALDTYANRLGCSFILIHHSTKGSQAGKSITDVGAGAGSQSRATDTHLVLREHEEPNCAVLDAAVRSWPPIQPRVFRWEFPLWIPDDSLDPADLKYTRPRRRSRSAHAQSDEPKISWTAENFAEEFITDEPELKVTILDNASEQGVSARKTSKLLRQAEDQGLIHRWRYASNLPVKFATVPQPS